MNAKPQFDATKASLEELVEHIEDYYHSAARFDLGVLQAHLDTCLDSAEGEPLEKLRSIEGRLLHFREDFIGHLRAEERGIFRLVRGEGPETRTRTVADVDSHHDHLALQMAELAEAVGSHTAGEAYAAAWGRFLSKLKQVVADFSEHSRLETEVMFPRAIKAGLVLAGATSPTRGMP